MNIEKFGNLLKKLNKEKFIGYHFHTITISPQETKKFLWQGTDLIFLNVSLAGIQFALNEGELIPQTTPLLDVEQFPFYSVTFFNSHAVSNITADLVIFYNPFKFLE